MSKFISKAWWPKGTVPGDTSVDKHDTLEAAQAVCKLLEEEGYAGERKLFPTKTVAVEFDEWGFGEVLERRRVIDRGLVQALNDKMDAWAGAHTHDQNATKRSVHVQYAIYLQRLLIDTGLEDLQSPEACMIKKLIETAKIAAAKLGDESNG